AQGADMIGERAAADALVMPAVERRRQAEMRGAAVLFPEARLLRPIRLVARTHRHPNLDADLFRVAPRLLGQAAQLRQDVERALVGRIGIRHPAVAEFCDALQGALDMPAEPHRHLAGGGARVDAGVVDRVIAAFESDVRRGPQFLHDLDLLLGAAAAIVEILLESGGLDPGPAAADAETG